MITKRIEAAIEALTNGELVAIPTETVYGLAANAFSEQAVKKIFELKKRPLYNPLIVHIKSVDDLPLVARDIPEEALQLARAFWPGPLTLILKKQKSIPDIVTSGKDTVAVRVPDHSLTLSLLNKIPFPLAAPSANPFGSVSPTSAAHVQQYFGGEVSLVLDGGPCEKGIESTIVGFEDNLPVIYRLGSLPAEEIEEKTGALTIKNYDRKAPVAPGMLNKHYSPKTAFRLTRDVDTLLEEFAGQKIGLLLLTERNDLRHAIAHQEILSATGNLTEAARNLYAAMHRLDALNLNIIIAERMPETGLGSTINDKLSRAAAE